MSTTKILLEGPRLRLVASGRLLVACWYDAPTLEDLRDLSDATRDQRRRHADGAFANVVLSGTPSFGPEVRRESAALTAREGDHGVGSAHLVLIDGFAGVAVRSFLSTMVLLGRPRVPTKVFGELDAGAEWLASRLRTVEAAWSAKDVRAVIERAAERRDQAPAARSIAKITTPVTET